MKLRLALLNIIVPSVVLLILGYVPDQSVLVPSYVASAIILITLGRAALLYQQQVVFSVLPLLMLVMADMFGMALDLYAPFALPCFLIYLWFINLQWGQRPWLHPSHIVSLLLLMVFFSLARRDIQLPDSWLEYAYFPPVWPSVFFALTPLLFVGYWSRLGRWGSYWPLLMVAMIDIKWADDSFLFLWCSFAALFSLSLDSYVLSYIDELTGIAGRRALEFKLKTQTKHYYVCMVDVDHFKKFNDTYGHQVGDDVLKMIAKLLSKTHKAKAYRYGGEEFCLVFNNVPIEEVKEAVDKTRQDIEDYALYPKSLKRRKRNRGKQPKAKALHVTASFGVAQHHSGQTYNDVIARADKSLYKAKQAGRNCVIVSK